MKKIVHKASDRIVNDLGWLRIHASFREEGTTEDRRRFGTLLVLDDATMIPGGRGFKLHPHDNMEIISWVLSGADEHNDSENGITILHGGDVQLMSAGTGIQHAENNASATEAVHMLQIWIEPLRKNIKPAYQVKSLKDTGRNLNEVFTFISPDGANASLVINQQSYFSVVTLEEGKSLSYDRHDHLNGVYVFVLGGGIVIDHTELSDRDALGVFPGEPIELKAARLSTVFFIETPMST